MPSRQAALLIEQAELRLVRLPLLRRQLDAALGWNTAGYISGYRGSPIGGYDQLLLKEEARLKAANIVFNPGLNEDLAAAALLMALMRACACGLRRKTP
jgi:TPP-dependent indolepyruvate ferredoxin oxidoreductase alpha subunit